MTVPTPDETILGLLAARARHGYELIETFRNPAQLGNVWKMSTSQIYAVLKRLQNGGLVVGQVIETDSAPNRTEYRLTEAGRERLEVWLQEPAPSASIRRVRVEFLSRLYIANLLRLPTSPLIKRQRAACEIERARRLQTLTGEHAGIRVLATKLVIAQLDAVLDWLEQCEHALEDAEE